MESECERGGAASGERRLQALDDFAGFFRLLLHHQHRFGIAGMAWA